MNSSSDNRKARRVRTYKPEVIQAPAPWWLQLICFGTPAALVAVGVYYWGPSVANKLASLW